LGSFPTAYILLKRHKNIDIRNAGSGNVGAMNSYEVSGSRKIGAAVFAIDLLKGLTSVFLVKYFIGNDFIYIMVALNAAVLAHCFSPWINFKGGRGLATAGGGSLIISIPVLIIWLILWVVSFIIPRNIHLSNISATILTAVFSFTPALSMNRFSSPHAASNLEYGFMVGTLMMIILVKHYDPMKKLLLNRNNKN
jgi:glycerol-3-phosphate acyltransferase PlsY